MEVEKSQKWQAGGGTTALGIIGTALGGLATVAGGSALFGGNGLGGNNQTQKENNDLRAEVSRLRSEKYTDSHVLAMSKELSAVDAQLHAVDDKLEKAIIRNSADIAASRELTSRDLVIAAKQAQIDSLQLENRLDSKISAVAAAANQGIQANALAIQTNAGAIACLQNTVAGITKTSVPQSAICAPAFSNTGCCPVAQQ